jgi:hypothetical protein
MQSQWNGVGKVNEANEVMTITDMVGPILVQVKNEVGTTAIDVGISFRKSDAPDTPITNDQDTAVTSENTLYVGDGGTLIFSGQALDNVHILPQSITVHPLGGGTSVDATDRDGDGLLYTDDVDEDECGTINYATGALNLSYPAGKAPGAGAGGRIDANYKYGGSIVAQGVKAYRINNLKQHESIKVYATSATLPAPLSVTVSGG